MIKKTKSSRTANDLSEKSATTKPKNFSPNHKSYNKKAICVVVILLILISWASIIDKKTEDYVDKNILSAATAFGSARLINATVSVIQSASFSALVMSVNPGQILDPINDMVEDFSTVMKISLASLIIQKILIEVISTDFFKIIFTVGGLLFITTLYFGPKQLVSNFFKVFLTVAMLRFLLLIVLAGSMLADSAFLQKETDSEIDKLSQQEQEFKAAQQESQLSEKKQAELSKELEQYTKKKETILKRIQAARQSLQEAQESFSDAEKYLQKLSEGRSVLDSLNVMKSDPKYDAAKETQQQAAKQVEMWDEKLEEYNEQLAENNEMIKDIQAILSGREKGSFLGNLKKQSAGIKNALSMDNIKDVADNFMDTAIRLIALFILKTIVLPLFFLYIVIKGFERIWQVNLPEFLNTKSEEGKELLATMRESKKSETGEGNGQS
jgi:hypothetical protein